MRDLKIKAFDNPGKFSRFTALFLACLSGWIWVPSLEARIISVRADGKGDFSSLQAAVDSLTNQPSVPVTITLAPGRYAERVNIPRAVKFLTLRGTGTNRTEVVLTDGAGKRGVLSVSADDFRAENFTIENTAGPTAGPQMALYCDGKRQVFDNLLIKGWQDTLGSWNSNLAYFRICEIWGSVDFIYSGGTAVFDRCEVVQIRAAGGPLTAPSTPKEVAYGLVFLDCRLTKAAGVATNSTVLMRPWRDDGHSAFINCRMDDHITAKGWGEWDGREKTCRAVESGSLTLEGKPIDLTARAPWVKVLTSEQVAAYNVTNLLGGWNPPNAK